MEPVISRRWMERGEEPGSGVLQQFCTHLNISTAAARVLYYRGITSLEDGRLFLQSRLQDLPDPFLLSGMSKAVDRLRAAILNREKIAVHGDYDVDGISGTALLTEVLRQFGAEVEFHIPLRLTEGYGLSAGALRKASEGGARVALSVDCGVSAIEEARLAVELGLDLIITDHHQPPSVLPAAFAIINPHLENDPFPFKGLSGVGVAFFLLVALRKVLREKGHFARLPEPDIRKSLDLVALGTIADIVPLNGVNRTLVKTGLTLLDRGSRVGVAALRQVSGVEKISCGTVGFQLAPRLNAAGRLEDAALGVDLLLEISSECAHENAALLDGFNRERQAIEQQTLLQAVERIEKEKSNSERTLVLADERWHPGVIGIVASRLVERYHRPAVLIALENGMGKGSARSIRGFHLYEALSRCSEHLCGYGGHAYAAGVKIDAAAVEPFAAALEQVAGEVLRDEDLIPVMVHDGEMLLSEITMGVIAELSALAPFGAGNPEPCFLATGIRVQQAQIVGEKHLKFTARQDGYSLACIAFKMADKREDLSGEIDVLFTPEINEWKGRSMIQLRVRDLRPAQV